MTMHDRYRPDPRMDHVRNLIAQARPDQIARLIADIEAADAAPAAAPKEARA